MAKCPAQYEVRGGPSPILGTYSVSSRDRSRPAAGRACIQQIAHTQPGRRRLLRGRGARRRPAGERHPVPRRDPPQDHRGALGLVRQGRVRPAHGAQAPRMRALARGLLAALLVAGWCCRPWRARTRRSCGRRRPIARSWPSSRATVHDPLERAGRPRPGLACGCSTRPARRSTRAKARARRRRPRDRGADAAGRAGGRDLRGRVAGHLGGLAPGLGRVLVLDRRSRARWSPRASRARRAASVKVARRDRARACRSSGFALAVGGACVLLLLWPEGPASARGRRFLRVGLGALMFGTVAVLLLQGPYATGGGCSTRSSRRCCSSASTRFGQALLARIVLTLAFAVAGRARAAHGRASRRSGSGACVRRACC